MQPDVLPVLPLDRGSIGGDGFFFERTFHIGATCITVRVAGHRLVLIVETVPAAENKAA